MGVLVDVSQIEQCHSAVSLLICMQRHCNVPSHQSHRVFCQAVNATPSKSRHRVKLASGHYRFNSLIFKLDEGPVIGELSSPETGLSLGLTAGSLTVKAEQANNITLYVLLLRHDA